MQDRVSVRDLHAKLGLKTHHALWFRQRAKAFSLLAGDDYIEVHSLVKNGWGMTKTLDYYVTPDVAILLLAKERTEASTQFMRAIIRRTHLDPDSLLSLLDDVDLPESSPDPMYVYVMQDTDTGKLKIGISGNPMKRLKQIQSNYGGKLRVVAAKEAPNRFRDESLLHTACAEHRLHGEWFKPEAGKTCLPILSTIS